MTSLVYWTRIAGTVTTSPRTPPSVAPTRTVAYDVVTHLDAAGYVVSHQSRFPSEVETSLLSQRIHTCICSTYFKLASPFCNKSDELLVFVHLSGVTLSNSSNVLFVNKIVFIEVAWMEITSGSLSFSIFVQVALVVADLKIASEIEMNKIPECIFKHLSE